MRSSLPCGAALAAVLTAAVPAASQTLAEQSFHVDRRSEVQAIVTARCGSCDWERRGHEAAVLSVRLNGRDAHDLMLVRGAERAEYAIALGPAAPGQHSVRVSLDRGASAPVARDVTVES